MKALMFLLCVFSAQLFAADAKFWTMPTKRFMPENRMSELDVPWPQNITEDEFDGVLDQVEAFYAPLVKSLYGADLSVVRDWSDPTVNAYATRIGSTWEVHMFGGLARRQEITPDGFELVACHEMSHHVGGFPFIAQNWAAAEGQADYAAALSCAKEMWRGETAKNELSAALIPAYPKHLCDVSWTTDDERALCYRIALAGKSLSDLLSGSTAKFETPDLSQVPQTVTEHPQGQCRLDTYLAGAICTVPFNPSFIPQTEQQADWFSCVQSKHQVGFRPRCWFRPTL